MRRKSDARVSAIKNDELRLEHDISKNLQRIAIVRLNGPLAQVVGLGHWRKVKDCARYGGHVAVAQPKVEIGELGVAGEIVAFGRSIVNGTLNSGVVSLHGGVVEKQQRSPRIGDCGVRLRVRLDLAVSYLKAVGGKLPESLRFIHRGELNCASKLRAVDFAELVGAQGVVFEVCREHGLLEGGHHVVEKGWLRFSRAVNCDGVDVGKPEA